MSTRPAPADSSYRGEDRRHRLERGTRGERRLATLALLLIVVIALASLLGPRIVTPAAVIDVSRLVLLLDAAALAVAIVIGTLCVVRWRLVGQASALWMAGASLTYALVTLTVGHVLPDLMPTGAEPPVLLWLHPASRLVALGLLLEALRSPEVDARLRGRHVALAAVAGTGVLTVLFQLSPRLVMVFTGATDSLARSFDTQLGSLVLIFLFGALGLAHLRRGLQRSRSLFLWASVLLWTFALAEVQRLTVSPGTAWAVGDEVLRLTGLLAVAAGLTRDLVVAFNEQDGRLLESVATGATAQARIRAEQAALEERAHEARNALTAIEGATRTLERHRDRLDDETREALTDAISGEIARLQQLVSTSSTRSAPVAFPIERALRGVLVAARSAGDDLTAELPPGLEAFGRAQETAEVVQNLLVNARRYAPGSPIVVRAAEEGGGVAVRVEDQGPGVAEDERRAIFTRGVRGSSALREDGSGLGLYVSLTLMRDQGGDLWVEDRPGGGATFVAWLPAAPGAAIGADTGAGADAGAARGEHGSLPEGRPTDA